VYGYNFSLLQLGSLWGNYPKPDFILLGSSLVKRQLATQMSIGHVISKINSHFAEQWNGKRKLKLGRVLIGLSPFSGIFTSCLDMGSIYLFIIGR
jgi:hypothetical protein